MSEPTYVFKKGEGWIPITEVDVWLKGYEIRVGDVIDRFRYRPGDVQDYKLAGGPKTVKTVREFSSGGDTYYGHTGEFNFDLNEPREWHVIKRA